MTLDATDITRGVGSDQATPTESLLEVTDLRVRFDTAHRQIWAVNGVDFQVDSGEVFALVGESGSGKSVSMLSVMGLVPTPPGVVTGSIKFQGRELTSLSPKKFSRIRGGEIGMVFQDPMSSLNPVHPIGRQIGEALRLHSSATRKEGRQRAIELLDRVGIPNARRRVDDYPHEFSGGMRQRVMIAMALTCRPKLLIADEPTTALDVTVQRQIVSLVKELQAELGMAVVWITHDLGVVAEIADRVAVMYGGRIMETGPSKAIYGNTRHPYTSGLLRSIPRLDLPTVEQLPEIPGTPRQLLHELKECPFHLRCPLGQEDCVEQLPALEEAGAPEHRVACIHRDEVDSMASLWPIEIESSKGRNVEEAETIVEIDGLKVHFPVRGKRSRGIVRAVDGVSLQLKKGRTLGVVGESGCGKSTLGRTLVGLNRPDDGEIRVKGKPLSTKTGPHRRMIQMIFQDPFSSMNPGMKVADVVAEPMRVHKVGTHEDRMERAAELLSLVGLPEDAGQRYPHEFSGGQRQRIAIARALAAGPEAVVCDEPVSALDVSVQAQIVNLLHETQKATGLSLLFIAHDLAVVKHISDEIAVMYLGQIVELAPKEEIYDDPLHPYTKALLAAVPVPNPNLERIEFAPLEGDLPDPADPPSGCRFHTRCPVAVEGLCETVTPELRNVAPDRWVSCHLVDDEYSKDVHPAGAR